MQRPVVWHGAVGGLLAGAVVAMWFLALDIIAGTPFLTPALLGSQVFHHEYLAPRIGEVIAYSVLHFAAFAALGMAWTGFLHAIRGQPGLLLGMVFGIVVLNAFHYSALILGGAQLVVLPWVHVVLANLAGGMVYMLYLHRATRSESPIGPATLRGYPLVARGAWIGLIGATSVALWFLMLDTGLGQPFHTPAALGSALFFGAQAPEEIRTSLAVVLAYTVVHLAAFCVVGVGFVLAAARVQEMPGRWMLALMGFVILDGLFLGTIGAVGIWVLHSLGWWAVLLANVIAITSMGIAVWVSMPGLRHIADRPVHTAV